LNSVSSSMGTGIVMQQHFMAFVIGVYSASLS